MTKEGATMALFGVIRNSGIVPTEPREGTRTHPSGDSDNGMARGAGATVWAVVTVLSPARPEGVQGQETPSQTSPSSSRRRRLEEGDEYISVFLPPTPFGRRGLSTVTPLRGLRWGARVTRYRAGVRRQETAAPYASAQFKIQNSNFKISFVSGVGNRRSVDGAAP